jgi:amino acid adenylation domain-containing protein
MFSPVLVHEFLSCTAERLPHKPALICGEERWTYRALERASDRAASLFRSTGLKRGGRVVIFLDNCAETVISLYGALKAGGVFVIIDGSTKAKKLGAILSDADASVLVTRTDKSAVVTAALGCEEQRCSSVWTGEPSAIPEMCRARAVSWQTVVPDPLHPEEDTPFPARQHAATGCIDRDLAALIYTSGSSGDPKGVMVSHLNMVSAARSVIRYIGNRQDDIIMNVLPLSFGYGLYQVLMSAMFGGTVVLERSFLYPVTILERIERERVTGFPLVPTIAALLIKLSNFGRYDLGSLRYVTNAAAALPVEHIRKLRSLLPGARLFSMYGLTECKRVSYLAPEELDRRPASVGKPIPNSEVMVLNEAGQECAAGEVGELVVRGSHVACGYWNAPDLTARTFRPSGPSGERLLYSGDLFTRDEEGFLYYMGRKGEMIKTKGERVSPCEVENVLHEMPGVIEAAVIGLRDELLGQAVTACLVCNSMLEERAIMRFCAERLQPFMVPRHVLFLGSMPRSLNGKIDKKKLALIVESRIWPGGGMAPAGKRTAGTCAQPAITSETVLPDRPLLICSEAPASPGNAGHQEEV